MPAIQHSTTSRMTDIEESDLRIMALVAAGRTNIEVGCQLGISARHVGRRIHAVQAHLSAPTRVAAVVQLVRLGLL